MFDETNEPSSTNELSKNSSLLGEFQPKPEEILKCKLHESERIGHDLGFEHALAGWIIKHRPEWLEKRRSPAQASKASTS